ncbi:MAG: strawberry notch family protein [Bacteroidetes bacterium]|nr:strawberry notch family protein [Bacteroidota bacterium]MBS1628683.1 strawberry notch family protein [Bacteroidota bacterium]
MPYPEHPEIVLCGLSGPEIQVPELNVTYTRNNSKTFSGSIREAADVADFLRSTFGDNEIELQEQFVVLYLNQARNIIGYYRHSKGGITATVADKRIIIGTALKCAAVALIVAHNHPSGNLTASNADLELTKDLKKGCEVVSIQLIDHIILSKGGFYSFAEQGLLGLSGVSSLQPPNTPADYVQKMLADLKAGVHHNKRSTEKLAATFGIEDKTEVKELTELAIVNRARELAHAPGTTWERYQSIVDLYNRQANLSHRTSNSILLQQYSTPAPIAYLAGVWCRMNEEWLFHLSSPDFKVFEPSAGNGLLTIASPAHRCVVNEIDELRRSNLITQGFSGVTALDASQPFPQKWWRKFDAVVTNPPFGAVDMKVDYDGYKIGSLEQLMALRGLDCMANHGKAAIIIGGHTEWDELGRIRAGKNRLFFNYLYAHYRVADVINIDGHKLYSRQGTSFDVRLILLSGRKREAGGVPPLFNSKTDVIVSDFDSLYQRVMVALDMPQFMLDTSQPSKQTETDNDMELAKARALALEIEMDMDADGLSGANRRGVGAVTRYQPDHNSEKRFTTFGYLHYTGRRRNVPARSIIERLDLNTTGILGPITLRQYLTTCKPGDVWTTRTEKLTCTRDGIVPFGDYNLDGLGTAYIPASDAGKSLQTQVPDSMAFETHEALRWIEQGVGGDVDNFVRDRLGYATLSELAGALSAEQIDAVATAIYNIEGRRQGMIIGDQTGIGKGRVAAAIIRYACKQAVRPIFLTEKPNLFSDIYRDLKAIGSSDLVPFIINGKESKTDIKDEEGAVIYSALTAPEQQTIFESRLLPGRFNFTVATYSQFNSPETKPLKPSFLEAIAQDSIMILDEAHNSSGSSNTGTFLKSVVKSTKGVIFLSATFAKRPDNMPIYAMKTCMADCALDDESLVEAIETGGVALQEVISAQLVSEGQMLRRERSYEGIEVNYLTMEDKAQEHKATADVVTGIIRRIIGFQVAYVTPAVAEMDKIVAAESKQVEARKGTEKAGVDNTPYFSKVFNVINQMLFAIKAEAVAERAIARLREGKKPVIAFSSTMGAFLETMENERGLPLSDGDVIKADFSEVLKRGIDGIMKINVKDERGNSSYQRIPPSELAPEALAEYNSIMSEIEKVATGLCISPIDILIEKIQSAGFSVAEVTGRKLGLKIGQQSPAKRYDSTRADAASRLRWKTMQPDSHQLNEEEIELHPEWLDVPEKLDFRPAMTGMVYVRRKENTNDAFRRFNNNEVDVLLINQSGSTGASAHAIPTSKVPANEVRQRVMIVLQAELDINTEVQKRGRINRTGQILKPIYDYLTSAIPAEQRLMMMLQKKLKSLDANTSSNQKQSASILDVPDFLNKYGDKVVKEYLMDNPELNELLDDPLKLKDSGDSAERKEVTAVENAAQKVSGRVAVLSTDMQKGFYDEISQRYNDLVSYLRQAGEYDLELEAMNLQAETVRSNVVSVGSGGGSPFGENVNLELVEANVLRKPYTATELSNILKEALNGQDAKEYQTSLQEEFKAWQDAKLQAELTVLNGKYERLMEEVPLLKSIQRIEDLHERQDAIKEQEQKVKEAKELATRKAAQKSRNIEQSLTEYFRFFHTGRMCAYPVAVMGMGVENVPTVFLGFVIDRRKANPFAPSAVKLRFAIANGMKYLELPASMHEQISPIMAASIHTRQPHSEEALLQSWTDAVSGSQAARKKRYIITGNLLQALGNFKGRLIDYTTLNGGNEKGLLMPESWNPDEKGSGGDKVSVPLSKASDIIRSMQPGNNVKCSNGLIIAREYSQRFKLYVPASRQGGGDIYLDRDVMELVQNNIWEKQSDKMVTYVPVSGIDAFLTLMGEKHPGTVPVARHMMASVNVSNQSSGEGRRHYSIKPPAPAPSEETVAKAKANDVKVRALALELEMEMELELA